MKRPMMERLHKELGEALAKPGGGIVEVEMYGVGGHTADAVETLRINNDDMERDEVPAEAIYADATQT
jgi:hypothetical protein